MLFRSVNGDGYADVIVGARGNDDAGSLAGEAYVYHGSASGLSATPDWSDQGEAASDYFGWSVASAGDVNGDGTSDVMDIVQLVNCILIDSCDGSTPGLYSGIPRTFPGCLW